MRRDPLSVVLTGLIRLYRLIPKRAETCRYHPSCSAYGLEAIQVHGPIRGLWLTLRRLGRCQPWGGTGLDPVPPRKGTSVLPSQFPRPHPPTAGSVAAGLEEQP